MAVANEEWSLREELLMLSSSGPDDSSPSRGKAIGLKEVAFGERFGH